MKDVSLTEVDRDDFRRLLHEISVTNMPFGKFGPKDYPPRGIPLMDLPAEYLEWFMERGFPKGQLGELMKMVCVIKEAGMDEVFQPLRNKVNGGRVSVQKRRLRPTDFGSSE